MLSFWEKSAMIEADIIIVGGGITGLSAAATLIENNPKLRIKVLERGVLPSGASTKNAGFACFGSLTEILDDLDAISPEESAALVETRWKGLEKLRKRLGDEKIGYEGHGGYELISTKDYDCLNRIEEINKLLHPIFHKHVFHEDEELKEIFGFNAEKVETIISNPLEGQLHPGLMIRSLSNYVKNKHVEIITGADVVGLNKGGNHVEVEVQVPFDHSETIQFRAEKVLICNNAFVNKLLPQVDMKPGRGFVMVTKPIEDLKFQGTFHYDRGYFYFRNIENRVLIGGGRNLDYIGEETTEFGTNQLIKDRLIDDLKNVILPGVDVEIDHEWSGIMGFGPNKQPVIQNVGDGVFTAVRLGGMGIAIGSSLGEKLAEIVINN
ncbi:NAD(P)/FAD-dependent oxidoreductase [Marinigracilibium pacificum]|uniref:FAD-binding oxidoreductase n=1 Tax=Marinigracilibium pacificum TaxID=2729599 RepID=A0A848IZ55_9BACT|nr:FAD-binding oxidoreductase [Marinigracilibium pacificum]NMM48641.1 FAD-binding oxidoreductase [Marinigracilibium pacificum]